MTLLGVIAVVGVIFGAIFSAAESALQRLTRSHVAELKQEGRPRADLCGTILDNRAEAILGTGAARLMFKLMAAVAVTLLIADLLPNWWSVFLVSVVVVTILVAIVMGSQPRDVGRRNPGNVVHRLARGIRALGVLARPAIAMRHRRAARDESGRALEDREQAAEDLREMVYLVSESDHIEDEERDMLQSVFELGRTLTREVMVPRPDMITVSAGATLEKALALFVRSGFSRVPVIGENADEVRGVLYLKDSLRASRRPHASDILVEDVMRPARFVPEMKLVDELMREMQNESIHMAIVIDEYGGVAGLVTMEDLIEELVGEVQDEHDANLPAVQDLGNGTFRIPARLPVDELGELFDLSLDDDDVDTAGGLLAKALGRVPIEGAEAEILGLHLVAERAGGRRRQIVTMRVSRAPELEDDEE
ncbi:MAG TPA: hemolysin family protein [Actinomycetaceae bacterium]|nr:hemolysin family protein [Actinomycetaceae bacterium]